MKNVVSILIIILLAVPSFAQINQDQELYKAKVIKYTKMKKAGTGLIVAGGLLTVVGVVVGLNSSITTTDDGYGNIERYTEGNLVLAYACFYLGNAGLGAGIPLAIIGSKSKRKYESKLQTLSVKLNPNPNQASLSLIYRF